MSDSFWETAVGPGPKYDATGQRLYGAVEAIVTDNVDPDGLGRVKLRFPWWSGRETEETVWARIAHGMAGRGQGLWFLPEVDEEVVVMFEHGDVRFPFVIGMVWNNKDKPPTVSDVDGQDKEKPPHQVAGEADDFNKNGKNDCRFLRSRNGHVLRFHDNAGIAIMDNSGVHRVDINPDTSDVTVMNGDGDIEILAPTGTVRIKGNRVRTLTKEKTSITSRDKVDLLGKEELSVSSNGGMELLGSGPSQVVAARSLGLSSAQMLAAVGLNSFTALSAAGNVSVGSAGAVSLLGATVSINPPTSVGDDPGAASRQAIAAGSLLGSILQVMRPEGEEEEKKKLAATLADALAGGSAPADASEIESQKTDPLKKMVEAEPTEPLAAPRQKATDAPDALEKKKGRERDEQGKLVFRIRFRIDEDSSEGQDDTARLSSDDKRYERTLSVMSDGQRVEDGVFQLTFDGLHDGRYSLRYDPGSGGEPYMLFEDRTIDGTQTA